VARKVSNKDIAKAFRNAIPRLAKTRESIGLRATRQHEFICHAIHAGNLYDYADITDITKAGFAARKVIQDRIAPEITLDSWLRRFCGIDFEYSTPNAMQEHRHAWLQKLIKEFETKV